MKQIELTVQERILLERLLDDVSLYREDGTLGFALNYVDEQDLNSIKLKVIAARYAKHDTARSPGSN